MALELPKHLFKRGSNYAVRFSVPLEYQTAIGRKEVVRSLGTSDLYEALGKRDAVLKLIEGELKDQLEGRQKKQSIVSKRTTGSTVREPAVSPSECTAQSVFAQLFEKVAFVETSFSFKLKVNFKGALQRASHTGHLHGFINLLFGAPDGGC